MLTSSSRAADAPLDDAPTRTAKAEIATFVVLVLGASTASTAGAAALGADLRHVDEAPMLAQALLYGTAAIPVLAAVLARRLTGQPVRRAGWGLRRCSPAWLVHAWLAALAYAGTAVVAVWALRLGRFDGTTSSTVAAAVAVTAGVIPFAVLAMGEELAWRGSLTSRVAARTSPANTALFVGIVWSAFHWPLLLLVPGATSGAPAWWGTACFTVSLTAISFPLHRMWQRTASVWPAVVLHGAHNAVLYFVAEPLTADTSVSGWFAGETGLALTVTAVLTSAWLWRRWRPA